MRRSAPSGCPCGRLRKILYIDQTQKPDNGVCRFIIRYFRERGKDTRGQGGCTAGGGYVKEYYVGLDLGKRGVGWSVTDCDGQLIRYGRHHHLWGVAMFEEAENAGKRRKYRLVRRRMQRRKFRIRLLQQLLMDEMDSVDPDFFVRLRESALAAPDRTTRNLYQALPERVFSDGYDRGWNRASGNVSIPVYCLRRMLIEHDAPADIRYVYLALAHIIRYRGNMLYDTAEPEEAEEEAMHALMELGEKLNEVCSVRLLVTQETVEAAMHALADPGMDRKTLAGEWLTAFRTGKSSERVIRDVVDLVSGASVSLSRLMPEEDRDQYGDIALSFQDEDWEDRAQDLPEDTLEILNLIFRLYQWRILVFESGDGESLSVQMDRLSEKHREDLVRLKAWMKKYAGPEKYRAFFHDDTRAVSYGAYTGTHTAADRYTERQWNRCTQEEMYEEIRRLFEEHPEGAADSEAMLGQMYTEDGQMIPNGFLPLQRIRYNRVIPFQRQLRDLEAILERQAPYHPCLRENREKIISLCSFRIPYYVGPLRQDEHSPFRPWIRYRGQKTGAITPWNFEDRIDLDATAESYMNQKRQSCSMISTETVLPRHSLLYEEFCVLNELNRFRVNDKLIRLTWKRQLIRDVYMKYRKVTPVHIRKWFEENTDVDRPVRLTTPAGDVRKVSGSLRTWIDMERIFGRQIEPGDLLVRDLEQAILWITVFPEKEMVRRALEKRFKGQFTEEQISALAACGYQGWGSLSAKLLDGIKGIRGEDPVTIIEVMRCTNKNLSQVIYSKKYGFREMIDLEQSNSLSEDIRIEDLDEMSCPPAGRRMMWTAVRILKELEEVLGGKPRGIYIRNYRDENARRKLEQNTPVKAYDWIRQLYRYYEKIAGEKIPKYLLDELKDRKDGMTETEILYFTQLGRCMYSGRPIRLRNASEYEAVSVIPESVMYDVSPENKVLVLCEENRRGTEEPMPDSVIQRMYGFWKSLNRAGLLSAVKMGRLNTRVYDDDTVEMYVRQQIVDDNWTIRMLTRLLKQRYVETHTYGLNTRVIQSIRTKYGLRETQLLNDMTQVYNAFLTANVGVFLDKYLSSVTEESVQSSTKLERWKRREHGDKNMLILGAYYSDREGSTAEDRQKYMERVFYWKDAYFTYMPMIRDGKFYWETVSRPGSGAKFPLKENLDKDTYGGYTKVTTGCMAVVKYRKRGKEELELVNIPVHLNNRKKGREEAILKYLQGYGNLSGENKVTDLKIVCPCVRLNQEIILDGEPYYLKSAAEIVPARQLFVSARYMETVHKVLVYSPETISSMAEGDQVKTENLDGLLEELLKKMKEHYPVYERLNNRLQENHDKIMGASVHDKAILIRCLVLCMGTKGISILPWVKKLEEPLISMDNRLGGRRFHGTSLVFTDRSVTGIHSKTRVLSVQEQESI